MRQTPKQERQHGRQFNAHMFWYCNIGRHQTSISPTCKSEADKTPKRWCGWRRSRERGSRLHVWKGWMDRQKISQAWYCHTGRRQASLLHPQQPTPSQVGMPGGEGAHLRDHRPWTTQTVVAGHRAGGGWQVQVWENLERGAPETSTDWWPQREIDGRDLGRPGVLSSGGGFPWIILSYVRRGRREQRPALGRYNLHVVAVSRYSRLNASNDCRKSLFPTVWICGLHWKCSVVSYGVKLGLSWIWEDNTLIASINLVNQLLVAEIREIYRSSRRRKFPCAPHIFTLIIHALHRTDNHPAEATTYPTSISHDAAGSSDSKILLPQKSRQDQKLGNGWGTSWKGNRSWGSGLRGIPEAVELYAWILCILSSYKSRSAELLISSRHR